MDGVTYISAKRKYLEYKDPFEHQFATSVFGSYSCWEACCASPDLKEHIAKWRSELELLLRSIGMANLLKKAESGDVNAAKHLASFSKSPRKAGRPNKPEPEKYSDEASHSEAWGRLIGSSLTPPVEVN